MVNHWYSESNNKTACGDHGDEMARAVSVDDWESVSCNDCHGADYPDISAADIELRDFGKYTWREEPLAEWERELLDDAVNSPSHYRWLPVEVIEVTEHLNFCLGNVIKYVLRADHKGKPVEDLEKARWYLDREIQRRSRDKS